MIVLGLDVSTSITGYCMMDSDAPLGHRLIEADSIIISHIKDPYTKAQMVRNQFRELLDRYEVDVIAVEENLQALDLILLNNNEWVKVFKEMLSKDEFDFFMNRINSKNNNKFSQTNLST